MTQKPEAIIYCTNLRESEHILKLAREQGINVARTVLADNRAGKNMGSIYKYCQRHRGVKTILITSPDRIARSLHEWFYHLLQFESLGVDFKVMSSSNDALLDLLAFQLKISDSNIRSQRAKEGMRRRATEGYCMSRPPLGYSTTTERGLYRVNKGGKRVKVILSKLADGSITTEKATKQLGKLARKHQIILGNNGLRALLTSPYYAGYVTFERKMYHGLHEPLISTVQYYRIKRLVEDEE